jgi:hypothetical protein
VNNSRVFDQSFSQFETAVFGADAVSPTPDRYIPPDTHPLRSNVTPQPIAPHPAGGIPEYHFPTLADLLPLAQGLQGALPAAPHVPSEITDLEKLYLWIRNHRTELLILAAVGGGILAYHAWAAREVIAPYAIAAGRRALPLLA